MFVSNKTKYYLLILIWALSKNISAQSKQIPLETKTKALVLEYDNNKTLRMIYYGNKIQNHSEYAHISKNLNTSDDYSKLSNSAYTPSGSKNYLEPAISITHDNGDQSLDLRYEKHTETNGNGFKQVDILLKDPIFNIFSTLHYKLYYEDDIIEQWSTIQNKEAKPITLNKFASANLTLRAENYWLKQYHGDWAKEMQTEESHITHGIKVLDSKLGTRANLFQPPSFMVSLNNIATEDEGTVLFATLAYSGNFKIDLELDYMNNLRIISGINNYASTVKLSKDESFETPKFIHTLSTVGKTNASHNFHNWARNFGLLDGNGERLTLLNNWEATYFDFNEQKLKELLKDTKNLGVDLFLLDDGWFGNKYPRNNDKTSLGDWQANKEKLPNGITALVSEATNLGVKFGIWIEPEMISSKSELYEKHPEWIIKHPQREEYYYRNQLVLDLGNPKVQNFVFEVVDNLFIENPTLAYIKWDCNALIYNAYSKNLKDQSELYIKYVKGLYNVLERIRSKYPKVPMMLCSGGGGRVDYAALKFFTEFWPSDNTDPLERVFMQYEYSHFFPAIATANHVTDWGKQPIKFRTDVAMMGKLGFDIVIKHLNEKELQFVKEAVVNYDKIKDIIWYGDLYRLANPQTQNFASLGYVNKDKSKAVLFNYLVNYRYGSNTNNPIKIKGLIPEKLYKIEEINLFPGSKSQTEQGATYSGEYLMKIGINPKLHNGRTSVILTLSSI